MSDQDWSRMGEEIKDAVQSAIETGDFTNLSDTVRITAGQALDKLQDILNENQKRASERMENGQANPESRSSYRNSLQDIRDACGQIRKNTKRTNNGLAPKSFFSQYRDRFAAPASITSGGTALSVVGGLIGGGCGIAQITLGTIMAFTQGVIFSGLGLASAILTPFTIGGLAMLAAGTRRLGLAKRYKKYVAAIGEKEYCSLEDLRFASGIQEKKIVKDLQKMIDKGWFRQGHLDQQQTSLIVTNQAFSQYLDAQKAYQRREAIAVREKEDDIQSADSKTVSRGTSSQNAAHGSQNLSAEVRAVIEEGHQYLKQMRDCNDAIPGIEISDKISRMERVCGQIFERVEEHPELLDELRKFMKYYLPTTIKLLKAYENLDQQEVQGPNIRKSKADIESTLDTINQAFENLLDGFFETTAVDIKSDIAVMETLMTQEGLLHQEMK